MNLCSKMRWGFLLGSTTINGGDKILRLSSYKDGLQKVFKVPSLLAERGFRGEVSLVNLLHHLM